MELGTEDIFLESNKRSQGVLGQRFGNEGPNDVKDFAQALAKGMNLLTGGKGRAVVKVRHEGTNQVIASMNADDAPEEQEHQGKESVEHKLSLEELQKLAPYFLFPNQMSNDRSLAQTLMLLGSESENQLWLHGPPPPPPVDVAALALQHKKQFAHIRSSSPSGRCNSPATQPVHLHFSPPPPPPRPASTETTPERARDTAGTDLAEALGRQRIVDEDDFVAALLSVSPTTSTDDAKRLFQKIDVESRGVVTWNEFTTFLVSQTKETAANPGVSQNTEFLPMSMPRSCPVWNQHEKEIICIAVSPKTGTVFTGGRDGALRSWDSTSLRHQKLWYTSPTWITGIVLSYREQRLIVCTLDRQLVVFDSKGGDVLRIYRGKVVLESENGLSYAHETIPVVTVGGKIVSHQAPKNIKIRRTRRDEVRKNNKSGGGGNKSAMTYEQFRALLDEEKANQLEKRKLEEYVLAGLTDAPSCLEYHYSAFDEDVIFFGMNNGNIRLYVLPTTQQRLLRRHAVLHVHSSRVRMMKVIPALDGLLSCSDDCTIKLTALESGTVLKSYSRDGHDSGVNSFAYNFSMKIFISTGAERHGLVWDHLQEAPIARLEDHPCPTIGCFVNETEQQLITLGGDNSVFVFDAKSYKMMQQFHERVRSNEQVIPAIYTAGYFDGPRQRLLLATTFPVMHQLRRMVATCPSTYSGHTAPVVGLLHNSVFDMVLTVDAEHLVLGWKLSTGESAGISFDLSSFATSTHDDLRLTSFSFDVMQRRLITGFQTGTVVVWNVSNGQALSVIRAAPQENALSVYTGSSEVAAVGSLIRGGSSTHYVFSVGHCLVTSKETSQFTVANPPRWAIPPEFGSVTSLMQCTPQIMSCGTASGAVFFFHALTEEQDGHALWADEHELAFHLPNNNRSMNLSRGISDVMPSSSESGGNTHGGSLARVLTLIALPKHGNLLIAAHADGKLVLWQTFRRMFLGSCTVSNPHSTSNIAFVTMDQDEEYLAHADDSGNLTVFRLRLDVVDEEDLRVPFRTVQEKSPDGICYTISGIDKVSCFYGGTPAVSSATLIRQRTDLDESIVLLVTTSSDFFTRVFTVDGKLVGELGMNKWDIQDSTTFKRSERPPSPLFTSVDRHDGGNADLSLLDIGSPAVDSGAPSPTSTLASKITIQSPEKQQPLPSVSPGPEPQEDKSNKSVTNPLNYNLPSAMVPHQPPATRAVVQQDVDRPLSQGFMKFMAGEEFYSHQIAQPTPQRPSTRQPLAASSNGRVKTQQRVGIVKNAKPFATVVHASSSRAYSFSTDPGPMESVSDELVMEDSGLIDSAKDVVTPSAPAPPSLSAQGRRSTRHPSTCPLGVPQQSTPIARKLSSPTRVAEVSIISPVKSALLPIALVETSSNNNSIQDGEPKVVVVSPAVAESETRRTHLLSHHLDSQLSKLRACKTGLNEELKRVEQRLNAARKGGNGSDGSDDERASSSLKNTWTSRVASRLQLHELDEIQPPAGSKASSEAGRRTHTRIRNINANNASNAARSNAPRATEYFPSVTAPGTVVVAPTEKGE